MSKNILDNLFSSRTRVKVLKFLFRNYPKDFTVNELANLTQESRNVIIKEVDVLRDIKLVKKKK